MTNLNSLDLSYNPIIELRPELGKLNNIWDFPLDDLKLISPPHNIIERGKAKDIIGFLWSLLQRYNTVSGYTCVHNYICISTYNGCTELLNQLKV